MAIRSIQRRKTLIGYATPDEAPIYVDSNTNILKFIPAGSGNTEVQIIDASSTQTLSNKTIAAPVFTGQLQLADGTAGAPSFSYVSDPTTGFLRVSSGTIGFASAGNNLNLAFMGTGLALGSDQKLKWATTGNAGSGTYDIFAYRSAAKTLTLDTDGAGGALTAINVASPLLPNASATYDLGSNGTRWNNLWLANSVTAGGGYIAANNDGYAWSSQGKIASGGDGLFIFRIQSGAAGVILRATSDGLAWFRNTANGADASLQVGSAVISGVVSSYNGTATAGGGVPAVLGSAVTATQTANVTILSVTPAAVASRYKVYGVVTTTSSTNTGTVQLTVDYVDSQGTVHTGDIIPLVDASGVVATTKSGASKEYHGIPWLISINNAGTAIVVKCVITGSVSYTGEAIIERVA